MPSRSSISPCPSRQRLAAFSRGELPEADLELVASHLDQCAKCALAVSASLGQPDALLQALRGLDSLQGPSEDRRVADEIAACKRDAKLGAPSSVTEQAHQPVRSPAVALGEYQLLEKLGQGGMGAVYRARHRRLHKVVALKVLLGSQQRDPTARARFEREIKAIGLLRHPNVVAATDASEDSGRAYLVMEYVEGIDLGRLVKHLGGLGVADACELIRQAAIGLQHAHEQALIHRDVKPSNLMLTPDGVVKVLDLGLARFLHQPDFALSTASSLLLGSYDYMAPEQADNPHTVDARADLYGLGCTLFHLLVGQVLYPAPEYLSPIQKIKAHALVPFPLERLRPHCPETLVLAIRKLLAKRPEERFASAGEVADVLGPLAAGSDPIGLYQRVASQAPDWRSPGELTSLSWEAAGPAVGNSPERNGWRGRRVLLGLLLAFLLAGVVAAVVLLRSPQEEPSLSGPLPVVLTVTTTLDEHQPDGLSLRDAIGQANTAKGAITIRFPQLSGSIELTKELPALEGEVALEGPGADRLTIRRTARTDFSVLTVAQTGRVTLSDLCIADGRARRGGGILNYGHLTVRRSLVTKNTALVWGGGIFTSGVLEVEESTVADNLARGHGGGLYSTGSLSARNSTISGNTTLQYGGGLVIHGGTARLASLTITNNRASAKNSTDGAGGGLRILDSDPVHLTNTIMAGNFRKGIIIPAFDDVSVQEGETQGEHNFIGVALGRIGIEDGRNCNRVGTASSPLIPLLGPLRDNGGSTPTHALLSGSPALDAGHDSDPPATDQRGLPRVVNGKIDIGAVEEQTRR